MAVGNAVNVNKHFFMLKVLVPLFNLFWIIQSKRTNKIITIALQPSVAVSAVDYAQGHISMTWSTEMVIIKTILGVVPHVVTMVAKTASAVQPAARIVTVNVNA